MTDIEVEQAILRLLHHRSDGKTICPSEASREVFGPSAGNEPPAMERTRAVARRLVERGIIDIVQRGNVVPVDAPIRGPIRLRLRSQDATN